MKGPGLIRLLHVEDDPDIREIAHMALSLSGDFDILQCPSGKDALEKAEDFAPDIVLLDMMMPGMTGRETLEKMRTLPAVQSVPAIFMTARARLDEVDELRKIGAAEVISKPFDPLTLADQIKAVIQDHRT